MVEEDLRWLEANAFSCSLSLNDHRPGFETIAQTIADHEIDDDDWTDAEAKQQAIETNRLVQAQVYPNGSVSFYLVHGVDVGAVLSRARALCEEDQARWRARGAVPLHERQS